VCGPRDIPARRAIMGLIISPMAPPVTIAAAGMFFFYSDAIDFFHMDALSSVVSMKIHVDVQLTVIAGLLYQFLGLRVGEKWEFAEIQTLFRALIPKRATIHITEKEIRVVYPASAYNPLLMGGNYHTTE